MKRQLLNLFIAIVLMAGCSKDDSGTDEPALSNQKVINSFKFLASENETLKTDVVATINNNDKIISATLPQGSDLSGLKPAISISELAKVTPSDATRLDFSEPVKYAVIAEDGSSQVYTANIDVIKNTEAKIESYKILVSVNSDGSNDDQIYYDIEGIIDHDNKTISIAIPEGSISTELIPTMEYSSDATITPQAEEAIFEGMTYKITSENGNSNTYSLQIETVPNERKILLDLYRSNISNWLTWDISSLDISEWEGITVYDHRVIQIDLPNKNISVLTADLGKLSQLTDLAIQNTDSSEKISSIPNEIGNLENLRSLFLNGNNLTDIPPSIGNLSNLDRLALNSNRLYSIPDEIGNLSNLKWLILSDNNISTLPSSIGNLSSLTELFLNDNRLYSLPDELSQLPLIKTLRLSNNKLTDVQQSIEQMSAVESIDLSYNSFASFPTKILQMQSLKAITMDGNELFTIPSDLGNMSALELASFYRNSLVNIPEELSKLTNLKQLNIKRNFLRSIPQAVCNMEATYGTEIIKDNRTNCN